MATVAEQLSSFIRQNNGQCIDVDHAFGCQCMDLVLWWEEYLGLPPIAAASAYDSWFNPYQPVDLTKYQKISSGTPQAGDILVWGTYMGQFGHTAIFVAGNASAFTSFDQNYPEGNEVVGSPAKLCSHTYVGLLGWYRPILPAQPVAHPHSISSSDS